MIDLQHQELSNYPVGSDDRATFSEIARWISVVALLVCLILAYAWSRNEILNVHYQMERLRKESNELREINATLRAEHSSLTNPESVYREASKLGLVGSNRAEVRILNSDIATLKPTAQVVAQSALQKKILHE
jgi:cell division protein FtsL